MTPLLRKILFVIAGMVTGAFLGKCWTYEIVIRPILLENTITPEAVSIVTLGLRTLFNATWTSIAMGILTYALSTPQVSRVVALIAIACLIFLGIGDLGSAGVPEAFRPAHWLTTIWDHHGSATLVFIITIVIVLTKRTISGHDLPEPTASSI